MRFVVAVGILWFLYAAVFVDEIAGLTRWRRWPSAEWQTVRPNNTVLRVVSLNCAGGTKEAAEEVARYRPDIVLLQETPMQHEIKPLARLISGKESDVIVGAKPSLNTSIIARGRVTPVPVPAGWSYYFTRARIQIGEQPVIEVICTRLSPYDPTVDLWSPACWREQLAVRRQQREQMEWLVRQLDSIPKDVPVIVGGDFNAGGRDALFRSLHPRLHDAFREGGIGWGDTLINEFPFIRIDQIWVSDHFRATSVVARRAVHSDHRMVICDLVSVRNP
jgi:endonuclease/exonuclease/phosphatase (EEP) superfamily protein YafD